MSVSPSRGYFFDVLVPWRVSEVVGTVISPVASVFVVCVQTCIILVFVLMFQTTDDVASVEGKQSRGN